MLDRNSLCRHSQAVVMEWLLRCDALEGIKQSIGFKS